MELERTVANLSKELAASREAEEALRAQLEELASFQNLPDKVDNLLNQVSPPNNKGPCQIECQQVLNIFSKGIVLS